MCTPFQLLFIIKHFQAGVTAHLFWALTGTINTIEIIHHRYSTRHGVEGGGFGGGLGGGGGGAGGRTTGTPRAGGLAACFGPLPPAMLIL